MFTLSRQPQELSLVHAGGDAHLIRVCPGDLTPAATFGANPLACAARSMALIARDNPAKRNATGRTAQGFFERDHDVSLDIASALGNCFIVKAASLGESGPLTVRAKETFEEVTETR